MSQLQTNREALVRTPTDAPAPKIGHVLIASADEASRQRRQLQLVAAGLRVSIARTGFEAIVKASCHLPDLILIDDSISDIEAVETGRLITTCPVTSHIPIVHLAPNRRVPSRVFTRLQRASL